MPWARRTGAVSIVLGGLLWGAAAVAQGPTLTTECEAGFRRFIHLAQSGGLGDGVTNANVGVDGPHVRVELMRPGAPSAVLVLTPRSTAQASSRYFAVVAGEGATADDVQRVGAALDDIFTADPFSVAGLEESIADTPIPSLAAGWETDGWRGVLRVIERRMMVLASLPYTVGIIAALALGLVVSVGLLWGSTPPRSTAAQGGWR